jgi:hypothetical protein
MDEVRVQKRDPTTSRVEDLPAAEIEAIPVEEVQECCDLENCRCALGPCGRSRKFRWDAVDPLGASILGGLFHHSWSAVCYSCRDEVSTRMGLLLNRLIRIPGIEGETRGTSLIALVSPEQVRHEAACVVGHRADRLADAHACWFTIYEPGAEDGGFSRSCGHGSQRLIHVALRALAG